MEAPVYSFSTLFRILSIMALMLTGCGSEPSPLSAEHAAFIGVWEQGEFGQGGTYEYLQISASGYLAYARVEKNEGSSVCIVIEKTRVGKITPSQISVSFLWFFTIDFEINKPPVEAGDFLRMTLDGNALIKTDDRQEGFDFSWSCSDYDLARRSAA